ncbi:hypothetical protein DCAR_0310393 [Daucus carota subsp. sativus]|uniref:Uncharacterized protein n=1 Tax=Daucus carota subsp. sativus TaxID=79200 RepID=A0AAF0WJN7_DAUCS|nr:PREDICTED: ensconsin-like [Daucus carota subsp. sativus]WOG91145.1 hypothetical protein DCAR_0310393 [Daucus carota subsp. sativus]
MQPTKKKIVKAKTMANVVRKIAATIEREKRKEGLEACQKEDDYWREAGEGIKSRAAKKREEKTKKQEAAAARKAENQLLAKLEEERLAARRNTEKAKKQEEAAARKAEFLAELEKERLESTVEWDW